jgi:hypothetical protein
MRLSSLERTALRAILLGMVGGLFRDGLFSLGVDISLWGPVFLWLTVMGPRGDPWGRWVLRIVGVVSLCAFAQLPFQLAEVLAGAAAGLLLLQSAWRESERAEPSGGWPGAGAHALAAMMGGMAWWVGATVAATVATAAWGTSFGAGALAGGILGLFSALPLLAGHVAWQQDHAEERVAALLPRLSTEMSRVVRRLLDAHVDCTRTLRRVPKDGTHQELVQLMSRLAHEAVDLAEESANVEEELASREEAALAQSTDALSQDARGTSDPVARAHYQLAVAALGEEHALAEDLRQRRQRHLAKLWAHCALLERSRTALAAATVSRPHPRRTDLAGLSRRLSALETAASDSVAVRVNVGEA